MGVAMCSLCAKHLCRSPKRQRGSAKERLQAIRAMHTDGHAQRAHRSPGADAAAMGFAAPPASAGAGAGGKSRDMAVEATMGGAGSTPGSIGGCRSAAHAGRVPASCTAGRQPKATGVSGTVPPAGSAGLTAPSLAS